MSTQTERPIDLHHVTGRYEEIISPYTEEYMELGPGDWEVIVHSGWDKPNETEHQNSGVYFWVEGTDTDSTFDGAVQVTEKDGARLVLRNGSGQAVAAYIKAGDGVYCYSVRRRDFVFEVGA